MDSVAVAQWLVAIASSVLAVLGVAAAATRPFGRLRAEIAEVRKEAREAHAAIGDNIARLGERLDSKIDALAKDVAEVKTSVAGIEAQLPHIAERLRRVEQGSSPVWGAN